MFCEEALEPGAGGAYRGDVMNSRGLVVAALLLSGSVVVAQQTATPPAVQLANGNTVWFVNVPGGQPCPVRLQARQSGMGDLVKTRQTPDTQAESNPRPTQRIRLIINPLAGKAPATAVVGATVTARGFSARARIDNASSSNAPSDIRRTLNITFRTESDHSLSAELVLPGFTAVNSIKLETIEYADGSTRDLFGKKFCTVAPDPLMLVAGR